MQLQYLLLSITYENKNKIKNIKIKLFLLIFKDSFFNSHFEKGLKKYTFTFFSSFTYLQA